MNTNHILATACAALVLAVPVSAYHIDGTQLDVNDLATGVVPLTSADFILPNLLALCESNGPADPVNPSGLPPPVPPGIVVIDGQPGLGGLCYTGRNAATVDAGTAVPTGPTGDWTELDVCVQVSMTNPTFATCARDGWGYSAQVGIYSCFVLPTESLVYNEDYAWMSWDAPVTGGNGHVSVFPDLIGFDVPDISQRATTAPGPGVPLFPAPTGLLMGSVVTQAIAKPAAAIGNQPCGASDPWTALGVTGPVGILP